VKGYTVCQVHGAGSPRKGRPGGGPPIAGGRYSRHIPTRLLNKYKEAVEDTELLALRQDIALVDARLSDLLERVDTGEAGHLWRAAQQALFDFKAATAAKRQLEQQKAFMHLEQTLNLGAADAAAWAEVGILLEQRRKLVESEHKRLVAMEQMISSEQAMALVARLVGIVNDRITDNRVRAAIAADLRALVDPIPGGSA